MFNAGNITTPLLVTFGNQDGAVDWHQGIEMFTTMRRMQKPFIMLVYEGENHGLRKDENMLDYSLKVKQFIDHYLLGEPAEKWIEEGRTFIEKKEEEQLAKEK
jgi:dipeptidyl aminopeptidase/acylaminoacyl peptidase